MTTSDEDECEHAKVYSGHILLSDPPQHPWICSKCLAEGVDRERVTIRSSYDELKRRKKEQGR